MMTAILGLDIMLFSNFDCLDCTVDNCAVGAIFQVGWIFLYSMEKMTEELCKEHAKLPEPPPEIEATLAVLSGKWKILILWQLMRRECRFNELRRAINGVSQHMLTTQLRDLERHGIIIRTVFPEVPPRVEYALT